MMFAFFQEVPAVTKWAVDQGAMAVMLVGLALFVGWIAKRLVDKWIGTLEKTDTHLDATTKVMVDISVSLAKMSGDIGEIKSTANEINRHTQPKGPSAG